MTEKRVDDGRMMNNGQQNHAGRPGLGTRLLGEARKILSFGLIGVVNGLVNYVVTVGLTLFVLTRFGLAADDIALGVAKALGWAVAVTNSYLLNTMITFAAESGRRLSWRTYGKFVASGTLGLTVEVLSFLVAVRYLPLALAAIVPIGFAFIANFAMTRFVVFPSARK